MPEGDIIAAAPDPAPHRAEAGDNILMTHQSADAIRHIRDGAFCWQSKAALQVIRESFDRSATTAEKKIDACISDMASVCAPSVCQMSKRFRLPRLTRLSV
jgi:predicted DNA-binding protein (UPF0251 family)